MAVAKRVIEVERLRLPDGWLCRKTVRLPTGRKQRISFKIPKVLYHGTSSILSKSIAQRGLLPLGRKDVGWKAVWMTNDPAYATIEGDATVHGDAPLVGPHGTPGIGGETTLLKIDTRYLDCGGLDRWQAYPVSENYFGKKLRRRRALVFRYKGVVPPKAVRRVPSVRDNPAARVGDYQFTWYTKGDPPPPRDPSIRPGVRYPSRRKLSKLLDQYELKLLDRGVVGFHTLRVVHLPSRASLDLTRPVVRERQNPLRARWKIVQDLVRKAELDAYENERDELLLEVHESLLKDARKAAQEVYDGLVKEKLWPRDLSPADQDILVSWILAIPRLAVRKKVEEADPLERLNERVASRFSPEAAAALGGSRGRQITRRIVEFAAETLAANLRQNLPVVRDRLIGNHPALAEAAREAGVSSEQLLADLRERVIEFFPEEIP